MPLDVNSAPWRPQGRSGVESVPTDASARKAAEAALRDSERRYRTLAEAAHDSIFIVDADSRITYANAISCERFGVLNQDTIGKRLDAVFPPDVARNMWRELSVVFASSKRHSFEESFETPTGPLWLEAWLVPMMGDGGKVEAVMGVARDVTTRKQLERQFLQAQKMEGIGQLAGGIAHDFNNLLTAILGYTSLVLDRVEEDPGLAADVQQIKLAGERAGRLTRQLLAFGRRQLLDPRPIDLNVILTELGKMLGRVIGEDVHLDIVTAAGLDCVTADPGQIEQVIVNLAVNARDAMPQGGALRISTENVVLDQEFAKKHAGAAPGPHVAVTVRDTGCGMTPDVLAHVFEPFFTTKPVGRGTGLGLATVYGIVKQSGGQIVIASAVGHGTTVTVYLPSAGKPCVGATQNVRQEVRGGTETILVVEDEIAVRNVMTRTLEDAGYEVLTAQSAADAIAVALRHDQHIDLVVSDVVMPGFSGPDVVQRIVRLNPELRVIYVSGFSNQMALDAGTSSRHTTLLAKPFTPQDLIRKVRECLDVRF